MSQAPAAKATPPPISTDQPPDTSQGEAIWANIKTIGGAVLLAMFIRTGLYEPFEIEGPSMEPTLLDGDRVVVSKFSYGLFLPLSDQAIINWSIPEYGSVVIVKSPMDGVDIVKRVIGRPGDTIEVRDGHFIRNGKTMPMVDVGPCETGTGARNPSCRWRKSEIEGMQFRTSAAHGPYDMDPLPIPEGHIFVMGDHRDQSNDSRNPAVGAIPVERVKGHALSIYYSSGKDGLFSTGPKGPRWSRMFTAIQ